MQQAWNYRAHVAGKTNLQFSLSIPKPPVYCTCPLETEQTAVKMFKRLCFLRYLCSWIPIDCSYIKGVWWQGTTFRASGEMLTPLVSSRAKMRLMPLRAVMWRCVSCMCGLLCQPVQSLSWGKHRGLICYSVCCSAFDWWDTSHWFLKGHCHYCCLATLCGEP